MKDIFHVTALSHPTNGHALVKICTQLRKASKTSKPTETHQFIKRLSANGKLVRNYSQNIDLLEDQVGLCTDLHKEPGDQSKTGYNGERCQVGRRKGSEIHRFTAAECVRLHGSLQHLRCVACGQRSNWDEREAVTMSGMLTTCPRCPRKSSRGRELAPGVLRPDIVLYGETDPQSSLISDIIRHDLCLDLDLLLVLGTSLATHGVRRLVRDFGTTVHRGNGVVVYVNRTGPPKAAFGGVIDYWVEWDCDEWVRDLMRRSGCLAGIDDTDRARTCVPSYQDDIAARKRPTLFPEHVRKRIKVSQGQANVSNEFQSISPMLCATGTRDDPIDLTNEMDDGQ